ncbi:MAG: hypothetical protein H6707_11370 [Deltaproteobacteria bacterium]|nr:hypothetical protein [Deltaproteobacteria bacterium]
MKDLRILTQDPEKRAVLVADCVALVDAEVKSKSGLTGVAVKTCYGLVKAIKPKIMENAIDGLLDDFTAVLQRYHELFQQAGSPGTMENFLADRAGDVSEELLQVTDVRARNSSNRTIVKAYNKLRPKGKLHVEQAVPNVGALLDRHRAELPG